MQNEAKTTAATLTRLSVDGMTCNNCARQVANACQNVPGVARVTVALERAQATIRWQTGSAGNVPALLAVLAAAGYAGRELAPAPDGTARPSTGEWPFKLALGLGVTLLLMVGEWGLGLMPSPWFRWAAAGLAGGVMVVCGTPFYRGALRQLGRGTGNMDTLVALGSGTAYGYSLVALVAGPAGAHLYFMEAAAIIAFISLGHWLEARAGRQAAGALRALLELAPDFARRYALGSLTETVVPVAALTPGDRLALRPGDRVPADGVVTAGSSAVDEAMLTGEARPVDKAPGAPVYAGTMNLNGRLTMRVTGLGETTALARIIAAVERAQSSRANIQRLGDRVSQYFVPAVVLTAIGAGLGWGLDFEGARQVHEWLAGWLWHTELPATPGAAAFVIAAAVLIVACPCAMGLATPAAIMAAANAAARRGLLIRDGIALEKAGRITSVLFDKTGTLTTGRPVVAAHVLLAPDHPAARSLGPALARNSTHPLSLAIATAGEQTTETAPSLTAVQEFPGAGVQALWTAPDGAIIPARLGSLAWLRENGVNLAPGEAFRSEWAGQGASLVGLALAGQLIALYALADPLKPEAAAVLATLQGQGLRVYLVTGDDPQTATTLARQAGIPANNVAAGVKPAQKAALIQQLQARGERVAFVGDGINDAPALTQAELGIAVARASDIAREAADVLLLKADLADVPATLALARATLRIIWQNLFWAFFYNAVGIPLAALGFASPVWCAAAMGLSDCIVIGNALRLLRR